jgi:hypothetical protein
LASPLDGRSRYLDRDFAELFGPFEALARYDDIIESEHDRRRKLTLLTARADELDGAREALGAFEPGHPSSCETITYKLMEHPYHFAVTVSLSALESGASGARYRYKLTFRVDLDSRRRLTCPTARSDP